jgi:hypothetical protein
MAAEIEALKETLNLMSHEREQMRRALTEYEGIREQLEVADKTMAEQHEMILQLQEENQRILKKKRNWKSTAQKFKQKNCSLSH